MSNALRQKNLRDRRKKEGWKRMWIPPQLMRAVEELLNEVNNYKG